MEHMSLSTQAIVGDAVQGSIDYMEGNVSGDAGNYSDGEQTQKKRRFTRIDSIFSHLNSDKYLRVRQVLIWLIALLIIVLNSLVIGLLIGGNKRHSRMHFYLLNLSIADLCVGLFAAVVDGFQELTDATWMLGNPMCKIHVFIRNVALYASVCILMMMSIDRALIVSKPLQYFKKGRRFCWVSIFASWVIATFLSIPSAVLFEIIDLEDGKQECHIHFDDPNWWKVLITTCFLFVFMIPVIMIVSSYAVLVFVLCSRYRCRRLSEIRNGSCRSSRRVKQTNSFIFNSGISRSKFKSIQLTLAVVSGFIICWTPFFVCNMLEVFEVIESHPIKKPVMILAYLHNVANPIIYFIYHRTLGTRGDSSRFLEKTQSHSSAIRLRKLTTERSCQRSQTSTQSH